jgi:predicted AlkP superfamily phosphohydrolase/phosphomutase
MTRNKTIIFGLDGACWDLIQEWLGTGNLPTLASLVEDGGRASIESCVPATTPPAWSSLTTGVNPGKHGVFGFYRRHRDHYDISPVSDRDVHARRLWDYTSEADLSSIVVNVPVTHPARPIDGVLVPGYLAPETPTTYPESALVDIGHQDYSVYAPSEADDVPNDQLLSEWLDLTESRADLTHALMERHDWDLTFVEFQKTDGAVHKFDDREKIRAIYERVDDCMDRLISAVDESVNVIVVSDHGIGQQKEWAISLNTWLEERGYLQTATGSGIDKQEWITAARDDDDGTDNEKGSRNWLASAVLTRQRIERVLSTLGLYDVARRVVPDSLKDAVDEVTVNRAVSTAFYEGIGFSGVDTGVIINEGAFYEDGTVGAAEYETIRSTLIEELGDLTGPVGPVFSSVEPREAVYNGEQTAFAPDIVLEQADPYVIGSTTPRGKIFIRTEKNCIDHRRNGLLVATGPDITPGWSLPATPSILDVTPTLLHLLDCPIADTLDGEVLSPVLETKRKPQVETYDPYEPDEAYTLSADERSSMEDRLKQMGYLE